jgi:hypothetical protein
MDIYDIMFALTEIFNRAKRYDQAIKIISHKDDEIAILQTDLKTANLKIQNLEERFGIHGTYSDKGTYADDISKP